MTYNLTQLLFLADRDVVYINRTVKTHLWLMRTYQFSSEIKVTMTLRPLSCNCYRVLQNNQQITS